LAPRTAGLAGSIQASTEPPDAGIMWVIFELRTAGQRLANDPGTKGAIRILRPGIASGIELF
jgi:hypothetical protein